MNTIYLDNQTERFLPCVATIGFFDGVHLGHRSLIEKVKDTARQKNLLSTVITFERHPRQVLSTEWHPQLLSTLDEKITLLSQTGIEQLVVLRFDETMAAMTARDFMHGILLTRLGVRVLVTGYDNHFGHRQPGSVEGFEDYARYGREMGMTVEQGSPFDVGTVRVSSSKVRRLLAEGDVEQAALCLGRPYELSGCVVSGHHIGTGMGFPTANLELSDGDKLVPAAGAYAVRVRLADAPGLMHGMMNIGHRPTFDGNRQTLETHIFNFSDNIYGHTMSVRLISRLRAEMKFGSREALMAQLAEDVRGAEERLKDVSVNCKIEL